ncbi:MAG TPA: PEP-CTERM sorting domain-containing protein [Candidatus Bathyarchaeia archaeon]|nr:PEP-CTERM sorting domain-containing protein [Candidatus Bathyarchaeia archaeon]
MHSSELQHQQSRAGWAGLFLLGISLLLAAGTANAGEVMFSGSGTWGPNAPVSDWSAPSGSWSLSFTLPNPVSVYDGGMNDLVATSILGFSYSFNGNGVNILPADIIFFLLADAGGFEVDFTAGGSDSTLGFACSTATPCSFDVFGGQFYTGGLPSITLVPSYASAVDFDYMASILAGQFDPSGTGSVSNMTVSAVPEPATLSMLAISALGMLGWRRK